MPGLEFLTLLIAVSAAAFSVATLVRTRKTRDEAILQDETSIRALGRRYALQLFLERRGRRYMWYLLVISTFLASICVASLVKYYG